VRNATWSRAPTVRLPSFRSCKCEHSGTGSPPPGCDTKPCRYQKSFFRSWPNPLLPILRPHGFSLCLLRSMRVRLNVRTQLPRFQRRQPSDSSTNLGVPAVRSAMNTRCVLAPGVARTKYASQRSLRFRSKVLAQASYRHFLSCFLAATSS
jgi:hypothetical protein